MTNFSTTLPVIKYDLIGEEQITPYLSQLAVYTTLSVILAQMPMNICNGCNNVHNGWRIGSNQG